MENDTQPNIQPVLSKESATKQIEINWHENGPQSETLSSETKIKIDQVVQNIPGQDEEWIRGAMDWLYNNMNYLGENAENDGYDERWQTLPHGKLVEIVGSQSVEDIFKQGYVLDCESRAEILAVLCRAKGFATKVFFTASEDTLARKEGASITHFGIEVEIDGIWQAFDPTEMKDLGKAADEYQCKYGKLKVIDKQKDAWEMGIRSLNDEAKKLEDFRQIK